MTKKIYPNILKSGEEIGIIAPSSSICSLPLVKRTVGYKYLNDKGLKIIEHKQCLLDTGYVAGSIKERVKAIHQFISNKKIKAIMCFWGGHNTNQLLDSIDYELIKNNPKIIVGYSDASALLLAVTKKTGIVTYLGPGVISFCKPQTPDTTWTYFESVCMNNYANLSIKNPDSYAADSYWLRNDNCRILNKNTGVKVFIEGVVEGRIVASSLSSLLSLSNTPYFPHLNEAILFIEIGEDWSVEIFDRMMTQCFQMGIFNKIKSLVISKFMSASMVTEEYLVSILKRVTSKKKIPVYYDFDCGHTDPIITIPNGGYCRIDKHGNITLLKK